MILCCVWRLRRWWLSKIIISLDVYVAFNLFSLGFLGIVACDNERLYENFSPSFPLQRDSEWLFRTKIPLSALFDVKTHFSSTSRLSSTRLWFNLETLHKFPQLFLQNSNHESNKKKIWFFSHTAAAAATLQKGRRQGEIHQIPLFKQKGLASSSSFSGASLCGRL